jgi:hypothetical protein
LKYESPECEPSVESFNEKDDAMVYSRGQLKVSGDSHPIRRQVCPLHQKEMEGKKLSVSYGDTSAKLKDLSLVLDDNTLLAESEYNVKISEVHMSSVLETMREKSRVDAASMANNWGIRI